MQTLTVSYQNFWFFLFFKVLLLFFRKKNSKQTEKNLKISISKKEEKKENITECFGMKKKSAAWKLNKVMGKQLVVSMLGPGGGVGAPWW